MNTSSPAVRAEAESLPTSLRRVAATMGAVAATLVVASSIHLFGDVRGRTDLFDSGDAGIAEAIIAVVLLGGAAAMVRNQRRARAFGIGAVGFATLGFLVGLSITARSGHLPDIAYHVVILPVLVACLAVLVRFDDDKSE